MIPYQLSQTHIESVRGMPYKNSKYACVNAIMRICDNEMNEENYEPNKNKTET